MKAGHELLLEQKFSSHTVQASSGASVSTYYRPSQDLHSSPHPLPLLILLHGYPQNATMFASFVSEIPAVWDIMIPDLPGYGNSIKAPSSDGSSEAHSKRAWGKDIVEVIDKLHGHLRQFVAVGHDRGARLAYSLSMGYKERVVGLAVLDIVPTSYVWGQMRLENERHAEIHRSYHWVFLAAPSPLPETLIASTPEFFYRYKINSWMGAANKDKPAQWIEDSVLPFLEEGRGKDRIIASCEDYRAGATIDIQHDSENAIDPLQANPTTPAASTTKSPVFTLPVLVLYSEQLGNRFPVEKIWKSLCKEEATRMYQIGTKETSGHFIVNEAQKETGEKLRGWLAEFWKG